MTLLERISSRWKRQTRAQSFVELALVLPVLFLILAGLVEVAIYIGMYLNILDMTREAARFASVRDPFVTAALNTVSCEPADAAHPNPPFNFYYHTSCIFSPTHSSTCPNPDWCNGINEFLAFDPAVDDIVISVYTVSGNHITDSWPGGLHDTNPPHAVLNSYWAFSENDADTAHDSNFTRDCQGTEVRTEPYFNVDRVEALLDPTAPPAKGFVAVEFYYCYHQILGLPLLTDFVPNPMQIHAYTIMPLPASAPTATTTPNP
jgi:hypothetical protein